MVLFSPGWRAAYPGLPYAALSGQESQKAPTGRGHSRQILSFLVLQVLVCRMNQIKDLHYLLSKQVINGGKPSQLHVRTFDLLIFIGKSEKIVKSYSGK